MAEKDYLEGAKRRSSRHRRKLAEMAGEMLTSKKTSELLGSEQHAVGLRRIAGRVWPSQKLRYQWDMTDNSKTLACINKFAAAHKDTDLRIVIDMLIARRDTLGGRSLADAIRDGDEEAVDRDIRQSQGDGFS